MNINVFARRAVAACALLLVVLLTLLVACSSSTSGQTTTTATTTTASDSTTSTSTPIVLSQWDKELAKTASIQNKLTNVLLTEKAADDDPRMAIIYGLRARTQAIACRQALDKKDTKLADSAMLGVHYMLNLGRNLATGTVAQTLAAARAIVENLGAPSDSPDEAAGLLDQFITASAPLLDEAAALIPSTTTT